MNRTAIKNFAIWARRYLREQVTARAAQYGITYKGIIESQAVAGGLLVAGQTLNATEARHYGQLRKRLQDLTLVSNHSQAVNALFDEIAYTWFNRLAALRFMEVNGYIGRVLSSSDPNLVDPDLLRDASYIAEMGDLPGLDLDTLNEWRSFASGDPNPDEFLYRRLLIAQCKALAEGIPALFDTRQNYQVLFLPGNLLNQDSIVRRLVKEIPEEDWQDIEVVGWLYQFYISERKDEVIGAKSKVTAVDIPAATQLFTPHWIVRYMVENSLGRLWLEAHPESKLREYMPYYLENPNNSGENENPKSLTPQELTVIDPACGSAHILVYAFDLLFEIYKEQGYLERDIPALILTHNLYGLDIDERAAQLASFAVLMKARAKNSRILRKPPALNITAVRPTHSQTLPPAAELKAEDWEPLVEAFKNADNLGSLITPPPFDAQKLKAQLEKLEVSDRNPLFREYIPSLRELILQAELLSKQYWVVVANPPYMGGASFNNILKQFVNNNYQNSKGDLFAVFMELCIKMAADTGFIATINQHSWMFLSSYENLRKELLTKYTIESMVHLGARAFPEIGGEVVQSTTFVLNKQTPQDKTGNYVRLVNYNSADSKEKKYLSNEHRYFGVNQADFAKIPGSAIAYWVSPRILEIFTSCTPLGQIAETRLGMATGNNNRFVRFWHEVDLFNIGLRMESRQNGKSSQKKWFSYNKGGEYRKWYGNNDFVINWENDGLLLQTLKHPSGRTWAHNFNLDYIFKKFVTWSFVSSSYFGVRQSDIGFLFDVGGSAAFCNESWINVITSFLCTHLAFELMKIMNPTLNFQVGDVSRLPIIESEEHSNADGIAQKAIEISRQDWDNFETSWDFQTHPLLRHNTEHLSKAFSTWHDKSEYAFRELQRLEEENNRYWIEAYGLQDELTPEVPDGQITIRRADLDRDIRSLISYAVGCMMGRYSLDKPGLIHAGQPFDPTLHQSFPADIDAIIPITDRAYFDDDIVTRFLEFLRVAYSPETLTENLNFIANALKLKNGESAQERIRRYFVQEFISDHIQTYKKRPIYWLFTSGKKRAFGALVYLHRYNEDTLARIRTDYVLELQVKLEAEIARAQQQLDNASSSTAQKAATNRLKELQAQQLELRDYQAKLQTLADARITLDLDDGVAYNYTRFKGLVYEGADLKMADLEKASQWKRELL